MSESGLAAASSFIQDFGRCSSPRAASPMPQPYGMPAPWPNGDGRLSEIGPNIGISAVTMLAGTFVEHSRWHRGHRQARIYTGRILTALQSLNFDLWLLGISFLSADGSL